MEKKTPTSKNTFEVPVTEDWDAEYQTDKQQAKKNADPPFKNIKITWVACSLCRSFLCHGQKCGRSVFD